MRIGILAYKPSSYSTDRLKEACRARGHQARILTCLNFSLDISPGKPDLLYKGKPLKKFDAIIPRIASSTKHLGAAIVRQFEEMGTFSLNSSQGLAVSRDKLRSLQVLARHKSVSIPASSFVSGKGEAELALERVGGVPVVIKMLQGTQGTGVILAERKSVALAIISALQAAGNDVIVQHFVSESQGKDIRAFVVGDKVVAAMRRVAKEGEFRSNVHLGGTTEAVELSDAYKRAALSAAHIIGLRIAGVDLLETKEGPKVLEVNSSPGLEGIEGATGVDVAGAIIDFLAEEIQFPDLDIQQRLSLSRGYAIADIPIVKGSPYVKQPIATTDLSEKEIRVLSISRGSILLPSPRSTEVLQLGDILTCFGKQVELKSMMPSKKQKTKLKKKAVEPDPQSGAGSSAQLGSNGLSDASAYSEKSNS
ncbi:MAG: RimK family alpha-L-glutamate ligase [Bdellovibrionales bacterium]|nr:RimK family alpha-L-glutamate ligase [Bdellovibrionales bacterium]